MVDLDLLNYLEGFITENRKEGFLRVFYGILCFFTIGNVFRERA